MLPEVTIIHYDRPDARAEATAVAIMEEAFDPKYGEAWSARQIESFTVLSGVELHIAKIDGAQLGFAMTRHVADETELLLLAVRPSWRRKGIGQILINHCIGRARKQDIKVFHLEVRANNPARYFYESLGFENVHRRPNYYKGNDGTHYDALSYHLQL